MQKTLLIKLCIIGSLCLLFAIGLSLIQSLVYERQNYSQTVINEISSQHVNPQEVITPFIAVPTQVTPACKAVDRSTCAKSFNVMTPRLPLTTQAQQSLKVSTDTYKRGIYHATSYQGQLNFQQQYNLVNGSTNENDIKAISLAAADASLPKSNQSIQKNMPVESSPGEKQAAQAAIDASDTSAVVNTGTNTGLNTPIAINPIYFERGEDIEYDWEHARLIIPVSDLRGVAQLPTVRINDEVLIANYPATPQLGDLSYVEVVLPAKLANQSNLKIAVELPLMGISTLRTIPLGQQFSLTMDSDWHAPNFIGEALPAQKSFDNLGFKAKWENQYLTVANNQMLTQCLIDPNASCDIYAHMASSSLNNGRYNNDYQDAAHAVEVASGAQSNQLNGFAVSFAEPNDVYLQTERTMKYALLLILVSFGTFFLFEVIKSLRIHPIQYLLVGSALLVFYVLLLPLAEQIVFWQAYAIAATACVGLIGWYTYYVLDSLKRASIFTAILGGLYAGFYGILTTEDMNLLLGAIFCFVLLASVMYLTRKIDWYQVA